MYCKKDFIKFLVEKKVLAFGQFVTKSGRKTPYFFNMGKINTALSLSSLADAYCDLIIKHFGPEIDNVFGPAYKGIPLSVMVAHKLSKRLKKDISFTFDRKEKKDHGEGGILIGHEYSGQERVVVVEDVLTSGISLVQTASILKGYKITPLGAVLGINRQEKVDATNRFGFPIHSLLSVHEVLNYVLNSDVSTLGINNPPEIKDKIKKYLSSFGSSAVVNSQ